jgi:hypothetical protein
MNFYQQYNISTNCHSHDYGTDNFMVFIYFILEALINMRL